jgi:hypothetical protein
MSLIQTDIPLAEQIHIVDEWESATGMMVAAEHMWRAGMEMENQHLSRCIVVLGTARSGTSIPAGVLYYLGVRMCKDRGYGNANTKGVFEDRMFQNVGLQWLHDEPVNSHPPSRTLRQWMSLVRRRNNSYAIWGVKSPRMMFGLPEMLPVFEDLRIIATSRDIDATTQSFERWRAEVDMPPMSAQIKALRRAETVAMEAGIPLIELDFEWMLEDPQRTVSTIERFAYDGLALVVDDLERARALRHIDPSLRRY